MSAPESSLQKFNTKSYQFGRFVIDLERACLMRGEEEIKLRPKSFALLRYFLDHPNRLVTKEELIKAVWPDSFVTDDSLVQCVRDIRRALDDDGLQFIKTAPGRGYIFEKHAFGKHAHSNTAAATGAVHTAEPEATAVATKEEATSGETVTLAAAAGEVNRPAEARSLWARLGIGFAVCVTIAGLLAWYAQPRSLQPPVWQSVPLTTYPGAERNPALSPDGDTVAFTWRGPTQDNFDIYIQPIASGRPQRLTTDPAEDSSPAWAPDGQTIAFLRRLNAEQNLLILIPAAGGPEHVLAETRRRVFGGDPDSTIRRSIAWTPDGLWIAAPHQESIESTGLFLFSALTGSKRRLTQPTDGFDEHPAFSPDGATLAFARRPGPGGSDLYLQSLSKDFTPRNQVKRLTTTGRATHPVWTGDAQHILYVDGAKRGPLRIIAISTSGSEQVPVEGQMGEISLGRHLVYSQVAGDTNVWRAEIRSSDSPAVPQLLISSTRQDSSAKYSPNGKEIAFISNRSGKGGQIWIANADGATPVQLTSMDGTVYFPNWSPNGQRIVFHARVGQGSADLFSIPAAGGVPKRLTTDPSDDLLASYSQNGRWIYFSSNRTGQPEIWKIPAEGGEATRLTDGGALLPIESVDGKTLFYAHLNPEKGIWKIPAEGGDAAQVTGPIAQDQAFAVGRDGIYYVSPRESPTRQFIHFLGFSTGKSGPVVVSEREIGMGLSLPPDEHFLIFSQRDQVGSDLMLIQNFVAPR